MASPKGTSSSLFQEQSTTARPRLPTSSLSAADTQLRPTGLRITPGKLCGDRHREGKMDDSGEITVGSMFVDEWLLEGLEGLGRGQWAAETVCACKAVPKCVVYQASTIPVQKPRRKQAGHTRPANQPPTHSCPPASDSRAPTVPRRSSRTKPCRESRVPVQRLRSHCPRSHLQ